jgi:hypothetical protein
VNNIFFSVVASFYSQINNQFLVICYRKKNYKTYSQNAKQGETKWPIRIWHEKVHFDPPTFI